MTFAGGSGTDYLGFKDVLIARPPWFQNPNVTHAWSANASRITWGGSATWSNAGVLSVAAAVGSAGLVCTGGSQPTYQQDATLNLAPYLKHPTGSSSSVDASAPGTAASGTAVPVSFAIAGKLPAAPNYVGATGAQWMLWSFSRSTTNTPFMAIIGSRGSTDCVWQRRNNASGSDTGTTLSLGTSSFVLIGVYSGTAITTRLNGVVKDNAASAATGGACTLDTFSVGGFNVTGSTGLYSDLYWTDMILGVNKTWGSSTYLPIETYLRRKLGV